jgi:hypothetical protein
MNQKEAKHQITKLRHGTGRSTKRAAFLYETPTT